MKRTVLLLSALAIYLTPKTVCRRPFLEALKPIGVGWNTDKWPWMSFVAFNSKGNEVASDGATTPKDVSGELSFWTFPNRTCFERHSSRAITKRNLIQAYNQLAVPQTYRFALSNRTFQRGLNYGPRKSTLIYYG
jgi:hypothetical protein